MNFIVIHFKASFLNYTKKINLLQILHTLEAILGLWQKFKAAKKSLLEIGEVKHYLLAHYPNNFGSNPTYQCKAIVLYAYNLKQIQQSFLEWGNVSYQFCSLQFKLNRHSFMDGYQIVDQK